MIPQIRRLALFALATTLMAASVARAQGQGTDTTQPERFQRVVNVNPGSTLRVENYKGTIHINGTAGNQVVVNVLKRFEGSEADRKEWMQNTRVSVSGERDHVEVKVSYPSQNCWLCWSHGEYDAAVELDIQVPRQTNLKIDGYKPDIKISSLLGDIRIDSYKAPMSLDATTGGVHIDTYKDTIKLHNITVRGDLHVSSYKADLTIDAASLGQSAELSSDRGSIVLRVPANTGLEVDFEGSRRAAFHSDFPVTTQSSYSRDSFRGTINQGGTRLRLRTTRGSVFLEKTSGAL